MSIPQPQISSASSSSLPPPQALPQVPLPPQALPQVPPQALPQAPTQTITNAKTLPDYYGILGVEKTATWDELRRAYRKLALKWHPDKNMHQQEYAEGEFTKIAEAYEVLSDDEMRKIYDEGGSLAEACCKRKYQQSNEVGEDDEVDEEGFFRSPEEMYAEAMGFGAGACVAGCCGGGQGFDPFAQFRRYGIIPNGEPHDHSHGHDHDHDHDHDDEDYDSDEDYSSEDYEDVDEEQSVKGDPDEGEEDDKEEDANTSKTSKRAAEDDGEPQMKKRKTEAVVIVNESTNQAS